VRAVLVIIAFAGCYSPAYRDCEITCSQVCPEGLSCVDGMCRTSPVGGPCSEMQEIDAAVVTCERGLTACGSACVDLTQSDTDCGRCGRDCLGGSCSNGRCSVSSIATSIANPSELAAGQGIVAYGSGDYGTCTPNAKLTALKSAGGTGFTVGACITALALGPGMLYLGEFSKVRAYNIADGALTGTATPSGYVGGLAATSTDVYVGLHDPLYGVRRTSPTVMGLDPIYTQAPRKVNEVIRTPNFIWFANRDDAETFRRVQRIGPQGALATYLEVLPANGSASLTFGGGRVFVGEDVSPGTLRSYAEDGSDMQTLDPQTAGITAVVADDVAVYFAERTAIAGAPMQIFARRHDTGEVVLIADETEPIEELAIDGPWLYWLTHTAAEMGSLRRTPK
jgi:hypothetical protein